VGALHDGLRAIENGLKPGERVIVNGLQLVRPGIGVEPKLVDMPNGRAEVRGQKSAVRSQRSEVGRGVIEKRSGVLNHRAEHSSDLGTASREIVMFLGCKVAAIFSEVERGIGLAVFAVAVGQLGDEMSHVATFGPSFAKTHAHGSRRPADLSGQSVSLLGGKPPAYTKDERREVVSLAVNLEVLCRADNHDNPLAPNAMGFDLRFNLFAPTF
jgi:hypothetical protein